MSSVNVLWGKKHTRTSCIFMTHKTPQMWTRVTNLMTLDST
uniref:Uncharacterized protein n=1 Tax=Anguilla anguilla TaxID=7936 RepID=A0A0E9QBT9_ANGAN